MSGTPREVSESYWRSEESRSVDAVLAHFHEDAVFHPVAGPLSGHAEIRTFYEGMGDTFPGLDVTIVHEIRSGDEAALEWEATLTDRRGKKYPIRGVNIVCVRGEKFERVTAYYDPTQFPVPGADE